MTRISTVSSSTQYTLCFAVFEVVWHPTTSRTYMTFDDGHFTLITLPTISCLGLIFCCWTRRLGKLFNSRRLHHTVFIVIFSITMLFSFWNIICKINWLFLYLSNLSLTRVLVVSQLLCSRRRFSLKTIFVDSLSMLIVSVGSIYGKPPPVLFPR